MARWRGRSLNLLGVCILRRAFNTEYYDLCGYLFTRWRVYMHEETHCCQIQKSIKTNKLAWNENTNVGLFDKSRTSENAPEQLMKSNSDHSYALLLSSDQSLAATWMTFIFSLVCLFIFYSFFRYLLSFFDKNYLSFFPDSFSNFHLPPLFFSHCIFLLSSTSLSYLPHLFFSPFPFSLFSIILISCRIVLFTTALSSFHIYGHLFLVLLLCLAPSWFIRSSSLSSFSFFFASLFSRFKCLFVHYPFSLSNLSFFLSIAFLFFPIYPSLYLSLFLPPLSLSFSCFFLFSFISTSRCLSFFVSISHSLVFCLSSPRNHFSEFLPVSFFFFLLLFVFHVFLIYLWLFFVVFIFGLPFSRYPFSYCSWSHLFGVPVFFSLSVSCSHSLSLRLSFSRFPFSKFSPDVSPFLFSVALVLSLSVSFSQCFIFSPSFSWCHFYFSLKIIWRKLKSSRWVTIPV